MVDNATRYKYFKENEAEIWKSRFEWHGEDGESSYPNCNIVEFLKEKDIDFNDLLKLPCNKVIELFNKVEYLGDKYADWAFEKNKNFADLFSKYDLEVESFGVRALKVSLRNHFVGSLGEFFFCFILNDRKEFDVSYNIGDNIKTEFNFSNVSPRLENEDDFGVDLVGDIEYIDKKNPCAIQVKFWNPVSKKLTSTGLTQQMFTNEMASGVYTDGILNGYIDNDSRKSVVVCWTLNDDRISKWLKRNVMLSSKMVFMNLDVLHNKVDKKSPEFWAQVKNKFNEIKTY